MPYKYGKHGSIPVPRFIPNPIEMNEFTRISDAESFLTKIATFVAAGELDFQSALELSSIVKAWIDSQYQREELAVKQYNAGSTEHEQIIKVTGGLPPLPGTNITFPVLNGHAVSEQLLTAPTDVVPSSAPQIEGSSSGNEITPPVAQSTNDQGPSETNT
jgi:hypothetical protein